ncbi:MAG: multidrug resistance protein [Actinomycetota bacterium]|nr:multidrug resistance protein [Actinomycetota bacterium]
MALEAPPPEAVPLTAAEASTQASTLISVVLLLISVAFAVGGQLTLKYAMDRVGRIGTAQISDLTGTIARAAKEPSLWGGLTLFGISALFWLVVLSRVELSLAYPFVGLSYVVVVALARFLFHEDVPPLRWLGVLVVAVGIALVGLSSRTASGS